MKKSTLPIRECELCLKMRALQDSHLLPAAVYKHLRDTQSRNAHPVFFSKDRERQTSRQARQYAFCFDCEQRFHRFGEDWTLEHSSRQGNKFKLREILLEHTATPLRGGGYCFCCANIQQIKCGCALLLCDFGDLEGVRALMDHGCRRAGKA